MTFFLPVDVNITELNELSLKPGTKLTFKYARWYFGSSLDLSQIYKQIQDFESIS